MKSKFNLHGNLHESQTLSYEEFVKEFGFNESRKEKIERLLIFLKILKSLGCDNIHVVGSFVSDKEFPNDIDICTDATNIDLNRIETEFPEFLSIKGIEKIKDEFKVHLLFYDQSSLGLFNWFRKDRNGNPRGFVKIKLDDI